MKRRKVFSAVMAMILTFSMSITATAATWEDVNDYGKLSTAFGDTDSEVYINVTGNIVNENGDTLNTGAGQNYTINGEGYVLTDIIIDGSGNVEINADLEGNQDAGLTTEGEVSVTVNGSIDGNEQDGVDGNDASQVVVNGEVKSDEADGIDVDNTSKVTVNGDVYGGHGADGVDASDDSMVIVNGNVYGGDGVAPDEEGNLYSGNINDPTGYSDGGAGVEADENAEVYVNGNVYGGDSYGTYGYAGAGIDAADNAKIEVTGKSVGGNQIANPDVIPDTKTDTDGNEYTVIGYAGDGITMDSTASVTVGSDVIGGDSNANKGLAGCGAYVILVIKEDSLYGDTDSAQGQLNVKGSLIGGKVTNDTGLPGNAIYYSYYGDYNPVEDSMLPNEVIETILSNAASSSEFKDVVETMAAIVYDAGGSYLDHETRLEYQNQYVEKIIELAASYGVDTEEAIASYVPEEGSIDTEEIKNLRAVMEAVVKVVPEEKMEEFARKAIEIGNEVIDSTDEDVFENPNNYVSLKGNVGALDVQGDIDLIDGDYDGFIALADDITVEETESGGEVNVDKEADTKSDADDKVKDDTAQGNKGAAPKTGDMAMTGLMSVMLMAALVVLVSVGIKVRRKR